MLEIVEHELGRAFVEALHNAVANRSTAMLADAELRRDLAEYKLWIADGGELDKDAFAGRASSSSQRGLTNSPRTRDRHQSELAEEPVEVGERVGATEENGTFRWRRGQRSDA